MYQSDFWLAKSDFFVCINPIFGWQNRISLYVSILFLVGKIGFLGFLVLNPIFGWQNRISWFFGSQSDFWLANSDFFVCLNPIFGWQ
jgi:hypothetical protein